MSTQPEQVLESNLINQLNSLRHKSVSIKNEMDLLANLKLQLEKHNKITLSDKEFSKILNHINKGNVFEKAKILRDKMQFEKDNGETAYIEFINQDHLLNL
jgi:type I restriction enzyme R subunit